jgi:ABC-type multidrug transport system ATPase subunit
VTATATVGAAGIITAAVRPEIVLGPGLLRGPVTVHVVKDSRSGARYELGAREHFVLERLNGTRTLDEIGAAYAERFGRKLTSESWSRLLALFAGRDLLVPEHAVMGPKAAASAVPSAPLRARKVGVLSGDIVAYHPSGLLHRMHRRVRPLLRPWVLAPVLLALLVAQAAVLTHVPTLVQQSWQLRHEAGLIPMVFCVLWLGMVLHELAHGLAAVHYGGDATEVGVSWRLPSIRVYCTVEDVLLFRSRWDRVATSAAGLVADMAFQVPFLALWLLLPDRDPTRAALGALLLLVSVRFVYNLLPLPPLDGYLMIGYALNHSRLAGGARGYVSLLLRRSPLRHAYPRRAALVYTAYAVSVATGSVAALGVISRLILTRLHAPYQWAAFGALGVAVAGALVEIPVRSQRAKAAAKALAAAQSAAAQAPAQRSVSTVDHHPYQPKETPMRPHLSAGPPAVVVENVGKTYGAVHAVQGVSLTVARGEMFGVLGPNGAGKTTLIEMMEGLRRPDSGRITVFGLEPWKRDAALLVRLGIQTQAAAFFTRLTAREHLETVAALYGLRPKAADAMLERFGLGPSGGTPVEKLSGGQRQRLALAAALVHDPDLLFLDEPTAALDPQARRDLWRHMREIRDEGKTVLYTTHHLDEAEELCDRVAIMSGGAIAAIGAPRDLIGALDEPVRVMVPAGRMSVGAARALAGVEDARDDGSTLVIATRTPGPVLSAVTELAGVQGVRTRTATLEDVYLNLTGSEYQP